MKRAASIAKLSAFVFSPTRKPVILSEAKNLLSRLA